MMDDPIVSEIRNFRAEHAAKFRGDLAAICADLKRIEKRFSLTVEKRHPRVLQQPHVAVPPKTAA
jgi:hypothetical protein